MAQRLMILSVYLNELSRNACVLFPLMSLLNLLKNVYQQQ
jgi:hypothetical protein